MPVADAVVARQVRGSLGGRDQVVAGQPELDGARQRALLDLRAEPARELDRTSDGSCNAGLDALGLVQLRGDADAEAPQIAVFRQLDLLGELDGCRVARVAPGAGPVA